jgi:hypothetical protein
MPALAALHIEGPPTTTVPPTTAGQGVLDRLSHGATTANSLILVALEWAGIVALVVAVVWLLRLRRRRQLVVSAFTNASGLTELDAATRGLGHLLREHLVNHLQVTQQQLRENVERTGLSPTPTAAERSPVPVGEPDQRVKELVTSLKAYVPTTTGPVVQLLSDMFLRPVGTRVTGMVQRDGSARLGITLELTDLGGDYAPSIETMWEAATARAGDRGKQAAARQPAPSNGPGERLDMLLDPAARLVARRVTALELIYAPRRERERPRRPQRQHEALIRNFIGMLLQSDALVYATQGLAPFFYGQATKELDRAADADPDLYQPYENRADTAAMQAQNDPEQSRRLLHKAIDDYETALRRAQALSDPAKTQVLHRLEIGLLLTQRRINDPARVPIATERIAELEGAAVSELDDQFLYNLACWFGLDSNLRQQAATAARRHRWWRTLLRRLPVAEPDPDAEAKALRYLAYCLARAVTEARSDDWASAALADSDLQLVEAKVPRLREAIAIELRRDPGLRTRVGSPFADGIDRALAYVH